MGIADRDPDRASPSAPTCWRCRRRCHFGQWVGLAVLAVVGWLLYRTSTQGRRAAERCQAGA